jgi:adenylylsulfate kinase-like enzyme
MSIEDLLAKVEELDDDLAEELRWEIEKQIGRKMVDDAKAHLSDVISEYADDMTGQDGEDEINAAARAYIDAQDEAFRRRDPDGYEEARQMGLLRP